MAQFSTKEQVILQAAAALFAQYGFGKTTMGDIAIRAGVARATVYNAFSNKDEVLRGVIRMLGLQVLLNVQRFWDEETNLSKCLQYFFEQGPLGWYDMIAASPDMAEVLDGMIAIAKVEVKSLDLLWVTAFEDILADHLAPDSKPKPLADFIYSGAMNAKYNVPDRETLVQRLELLEASALVLVAQEQA